MTPTQPTSAFATAMDFVLRWEGGHVNDPDDPGGETNYGISKRAHPDVDIARLTPAKAMIIYHELYWKRLGLDQLPAKVAIAMMDTAVNMGKRRAVQMLQQGFNELAGGGHLAVDGRLGPLTRRAINAWCGDSPEREIELAEQVWLRRIVRYRRLGAKPKYAKFLDGWLNRARALSELIYQTGE